MRPKNEVEEANYGGIPFIALRNLSPHFFSNDTEEYFFEDPSAQRPSPLLPHELVTVDYQSATPADSDLDSAPKSIELGNESLPVWEYRQQIINTVSAHRITIIVAETGAGKSTQVPQILYGTGEWERIILTQPRRAAARNVFERIRQELGIKLGEHEAADAVCYRTAGERDGPNEAPVKLVTDGLELVHELHDIHGNRKRVLILDEVHEWNENQEVLIAYVRKAIAEDPDLHVVIMSATMDAHDLSNFFADVTPTSPPIIEIPGRTFNVEQFDEPDSTVVDEVLKAAKVLYAIQSKDEDAANGILVFEPGKREINDAIDEIRRRLPYDISAVTHIFPLHAKLPVAEQQAAFQKYPGLKIIVSTDVAQTSLTIPDIKYVIDSGYQRRMELDQEGVQGLVLNSISKADSQQRAGRAGRVSDGTYILTRLDGKTAHTAYADRADYPMAAILRTDIVRNTLRVAAVGINIALLELYHPVSADNIEQAQATLRTLGALDLDNEINTMGRHMDAIPARVTLARMMVEAGRYSEQTRAYMAAIVASKEAGGLPYFAYNVEKRWKELTDESTSDLLAQLDIFIAAQRLTEKEMLEHDLDLHNVERAREQYRKIAKNAKALQETLLPPTQIERDDLVRCISAGQITSIYMHVGSGTYKHLGKSGNLRQISNRSLVAGKPPIVVGDAYRVEYFKDGLNVVKHILEGVTAVTPAEIGRVAIDLTNWVPDGYKMRDGKFVEVQRQLLSGIELGVVQEVIAEPSPKLRDQIVKHVQDNPGTQLKELRAIKDELEDLARISKDPVARLTHNDINALIEEATPLDITDPALVDINLRQLVLARKISLSKYVDSNTRQRIIDNAPATITINGVLFDITYSNRKAFIRHFNPNDIAKLNGEVILPDERRVIFVHNGKRRTLIELQEILGVSTYV